MDLQYLVAVRLGNVLCFAARMLHPCRHLVTSLIATGWAVTAIAGETAETEMPATMSQGAASRLVPPGRSLWRRLEISANPAAPEQDASVSTAFSSPNAKDPPPTWRMPYSWTRNEFNIGFSNRGVIGGFVRWRPDAATISSSTVPSDPAALATYRAQRDMPCCLPELVPPSPADPHDAHATESASMVSLAARLRTRGLDLALPDAWKINAGVRTREYTSTLSSRQAHVTVDRNWGDLRTSYSFQVEKPNAWRLAPSHRISLDYAVDPQNAVGLSLTSGREMAFFGNLGALNTEVRALALHAEHNIHKDWSFSFSAGYFEHGAMPSQKAIRFSFRCPL